MDIVLIVIVLILSFVIGAIGIPQIIGSLQTRQPKFVIPILVWLVILVVEFLFVGTFLPRQIYACLIGTGAALVASLGAGRIR